VRYANTGVQRNRLPHRRDPVFRHSSITQELCRGVGALDLEPLVTVRVVGGTQVVQHAAENTSSSS